MCNEYQRSPRCLLLDISSLADIGYPMAWNCVVHSFKIYPDGPAIAMASLCHIHMLCTQDGYDSCHNEEFRGDAWKAKLHHSRPWDMHVTYSVILSFVNNTRKKSACVVNDLCSRFAKAHVRIVTEREDACTRHILGQELLVFQPARSSLWMCPGFDWVPV